MKIGIYRHTKRELSVDMACCMLQTQFKHDLMGRPFSLCLKRHGQHESNRIQIPDKLSSNGFIYDLRGIGVEMRCCYLSKMIDHSHVRIKNPIDDKWYTINDHWVSPYELPGYTYRRNTIQQLVFQRKWEDEEPSQIEDGSFLNQSYPD